MKSCQSTGLRVWLFLLDMRELESRSLQRGEIHVDKVSN